MSRNPDAFTLDSRTTKGVTDREAANRSPNAAVPFVTTPKIDTFVVSVKEGGHGSDVTKGYAGPGAGVATGVGSPADSVGWTTTSGNKIAINGTAGSETIEIIHHSGAAIHIDADGSIFLMPTSRKGFGLNAGKGDGVVAAQGRLVLKGHGHITVETEGSCEFNVGQNMFLNVGGDLVADVKGSVSLSVDGAMSTEVVKDFTTTIGGISRETIAGDKRTQVTGAYRIDVGKNFEQRTDKDYIVYVQKSLLAAAKESSSIDISSGKLNIFVNEDFTLATQSGMYIQSKDDIAIEAADNVSLRSGGNFVQSSKGSWFVDTDNYIDMSSNQTKLNTTGKIDIRGGTFDVHSTGAMDLRGSTIDMNKAGPLAYSSPETVTPRDAQAPSAPPAAEYADANTIIDNMTTEREAPEFPRNAKKMSAEDMAIYENEGDTPPAPAKSAASLNASGGTVYSKGQEIGEIDDSGNSGYDGSNNNAVATTTPHPPVESIYSTSTKLSRNVTVGGFPGLGSLPVSQMGASRAEILNNVQHLCYNIIDPVIEKFGNRVTLTHGIRLGAGGSRHYVGKAIDMRSSSRNHAETAEIAKWIAENLPYDRLFLEANHQGGIHIHVEAAPAGSKGARTTQTCQDPACNTKTSGIRLAYAQQGLRKMFGNIG